MALVGRSLVTIDDLSNGEIKAIFSVADEVSQSIKEQVELCRGKIMASRCAGGGATAAIRLRGHTAGGLRAQHNQPRDLAGFEVAPLP